MLIDNTTYSSTSVNPGPMTLHQQTTAGAWVRPQAGALTLRAQSLDALSSSAVNLTKNFFCTIYPYGLMDDHKKIP